jgi:hypothetical protein
MNPIFTMMPELAELISINSLFELKTRAYYDRIECFQTIELLQEEMKHVIDEEEKDEMIDDLIAVYHLLDTIEEAEQFVSTELKMIGYRLN